MSEFIYIAGLSLPDRRTSADEKTAGLSGVIRRTRVGRKRHETNGPQGFDAYPAFPFFRRVVAMRSLPAGELAGELGMIRVVFPAFRSVVRHLFYR